MKKGLLLLALLAVASGELAAQSDSMTVSDDINICHGSTTQLEAHRVSGSIDHFTWSWTSGTLTPLTITNDSIMIALPAAQTTVYYVNACDAASNILLTDSVVVYQMPKPTAIITTTDTTLAPGQPLVLTGWSNGIFLNWMYGTDTLAGDTSYSPNMRSLTMTDNTPETGQYVFIARGLQGWLFCMDTAIVDVTIEEPVTENCDATLYVPNAFTPDKDGLNEVFLAKGAGNISDFQMMIVDRWGNLVFESTSINDGWDGTYKGRLSQEDVFAYRISYKECGVLKDRYGHVSVIR